MKRPACTFNAPGCYRLISAVLKAAIDDALKSPHLRWSDSRRKRRQARAWILAENDELHSFNSYCLMIGLEPSKARSAIKKRWKCESTVVAS